MNGIEWLIEAFGCSEAALQDQKTLAEAFRSIASEMQLKPVGEPQPANKFPSYFRRG